jgi:hypothetical protein
MCSESENCSHLPSSSLFTPSSVMHLPNGSSNCCPQIPSSFFQQKAVPFVRVSSSTYIMAAPQHLLTSTSSAWPEDDACPSTLRARLRDDATPATSSSINPIPYRNVYEQVHACLGSQLHAPKPEKEVPQAVKSHDPATQLRGWFTTQGFENHTLMRCRGVCSHGNVTSYLCD